MGKAPNRKLTFEKRQEIINEVTPGIILIDEFKHEKTGKYWCTYICTCGNIETKSWNGLQQGKKCLQCSNNKTLTFEERVEWLKERNPEIILLSVKRTEKGDRYDCKFKTTFDETIRTREWTNLISKHKYVNHPRVKKQKQEESFEEKKRLLKEKHPDLELIDQFTQYESNQLFHHYKCRCGNILVSKWSDIIKGKNCIQCKETNLYTIEEKQKILDERGINSKILSQTINKKSQSVCEFTCSKCGKIHKKLWNYIRINGICDKCNPSRKYNLKERQEILNKKDYKIKLLEEFKQTGDWWVRYICECGNTDIKTWDHIQSGGKCMSCSGKRRYSLEERIEILKTENPNITLINDFTGSNGSVYCTYICKCGEEKISTFQHLRLGGTCFACGIKINSDKFRFTLEEVQEKVKTINPNIEIIDDKYINSKVKLKCKCLKCNNNFELDWGSIYQGTGCPKCSSPKGEKKIASFLDINEINYVTQKQYDDLFGVSGYRKLSYDFYLLDYDTLIEYDGEFHFEPIFVSKNRENIIKNFDRQQKHDIMKNEYAFKNGIKLIRIPYTEFSNIEDILIKALKI